MEKAPATGVDVPATSRGWNGRTWPGHGLPFGPELRLICGVDVCGAAWSFHGMKSASTG